MEANFFFPSVVYRDSKPEFLSSVKPVLAEYLTHSVHKGDPVCHSGSMFDERIDDLLHYIGQSAMNILVEQGFDMRTRRALLSEVWGQEFNRHGRHDEHVHAVGSQISGFYFVEVPTGGAVPVIHEPRAGKRQINLPAAGEDITFASERVALSVSPGDVMFFNSWLPHGFTPHVSDEPMRFIHFNVSTVDGQPIGSCVQRSVEVV